MAFSPERNPYINALLSSPEGREALAMGSPEYGISSVIAFLKDLFLDERNTGGEFVTAPLGTAIGENVPGRYMQIAQQLDYESVSPGQKPRIVVVDRGMAGSQALGIGDGLHRYDWMTGRATRNYIGQMRIDVQCLSGNVMTAGRVSWRVLTAIRAFAPQIREQLGWSSLRATGRVGPVPVFPPSGMSRPDLVMYAVPLSGVLIQSFTTMPEVEKMGVVGMTVEDRQTESVIDKIGTGE